MLEPDVSSSEQEVPLVGISAQKQAQSSTSPLAGLSSSSLHPWTCSPRAALETKRFVHLTPEQAEETPVLGLISESPLRSLPFLANPSLPFGRSLAGGLGCISPHRSAFANVPGDLPSGQLS